MTKQTTQVILLEFVDEWESFLHYCQQQGLDHHQFTIVSLQPKVRARCKTDAPQLTCLDTLPFFNNDSHRRALAKSQQLTRLMAGKLNFSTLAPIPHTLLDTFIYYGRFYINNYLNLLEVLKGIVEKYKETHTELELLVVEPTAPEESSALATAPRPYLVSGDRFLAPLAREFCRVFGIPFQTIPATLVASPHPAKTAQAKPIPALVRKLARLLAIKKLQRLAQYPVILLAALSYNLDRLFNDIHQRFPAVQGVTFYGGTLTTVGYLKFMLKEIRHRLRPGQTGVIALPFEILDPPQDHSLLAELNQMYREFSQQDPAVFLYEGCTLTTQLDAKVQRDLLPHLAQLLGLARVQQAILGYLHPNLLLSPVAIDSFQSWGELGRANGIPTIVIPQKGLVAPQNTDAQMEEFYIGRAQVTDEFDYAVAQTPYVKDYLTWAGYHGTILETGNLIFSRVVAAKQQPASVSLRSLAPSSTLDIPTDKRVILYAPSMKSRKSHRFYVLETLDELIASLADVMAAVAQLPDAHLVIRIHPGEPITRQEIETLLRLPENVSISDKGTFQEVLACAALTVSFSSTSIQESLLNGVPVLLFDKWQRYNHLDAPRVTGEVPLEPAVAYYVAEPQKLATTIRWILDLPSHTNNSRLFLDSVFPARYSESFFKLVKQYCPAEKNKNG